MFGVEDLTQLFGHAPVGIGHAGVQRQGFGSAVSASKALSSARRALSGILLALSSSVLMASAMQRACIRSSL